ncbi:hypothetical protein D3C75_1121840 [compost metagenome]
MPPNSFLRSASPPIQKSTMFRPVSLVAHAPVLLKKSNASARVASLAGPNSRNSTAARFPATVVASVINLC